MVNAKQIWPGTWQTRRDLTEKKKRGKTIPGANMPPVVCGIPRPPNPSPAGGAPLVTKLLLLSGAALNQVRKDRGPSYCKPRFQMWSVLGCYYRWTAVLLYRCRPIYEYEQDCYDLFLLYEVFFSSTRCCRHFAGLSAVPGTAVPGGTRYVCL